MSSEPVRFQPLIVVPLSRMEMFPECAENDAVRGPVRAASGYPQAAGLVQLSAAFPAGDAVPETFGNERGDGERNAPVPDGAGTWLDESGPAVGVEAAVGVLPPPEPRVVASAPAVPSTAPATTRITMRRRPNHRLCGLTTTSPQPIRFSPAPR